MHTRTNKQTNRKDCADAADISLPGSLGDTNVIVWSNDELTPKTVFPLDGLRLINRPIFG